MSVGIDVEVEVVETFYPGQASGNDQFLWDLHIRWYGQDQIITGYMTPGEAVNEVRKTYPNMSIRIDLIPLAARNLDGFNG